MSEIKKVKIQSIIESQIPEFLNVDHPLFKEFLEQYYISLEHQTGSIDLSANLLEYKSIDNFNNETFFNSLSPCILTEDINLFDDVISVNSTIGFPSKYGLLKINNEIITYKFKTDITFEECVRGFSGINQIDSKSFYSELDFISTDANNHQTNDKVENLNTKFFAEIFRKFKYQFLPGFESRTFTSGLNLQNILSRAKDFYISKGTETSYKILFKILYNEEVELVRPREYMLRPSDNKYFITKNILVEKVSGDLDPLSIKGETIFQQNGEDLASASIYNVELRLVNNKVLYELSLDSESILLNFVSTKKTNILEKTLANANNIIVDSTIGFPSSGRLLVQRKADGFSYTIDYTDKTTNQFIGVTGNNIDFDANDVVIENNFAYVSLNNQNAYFRLINVIQDFDYSNTSGLKEEDKISLSSFGLELNDRSEFKPWIYNIPTSHRIKQIGSLSDNKWRITLYDSVNFILNEEITLINSNDDNDLGTKTEITEIIDEFTIQVTGEALSNKTIVQKVISKSNVVNYPEVNTTPSNIQNTYVDRKNEYFYVTSSGLPSYQVLANNRKVLINTPLDPDPNVGSGRTTIINTNITHRFYTGEKIYFIPNENVGIETGSYFITSLGNFEDSNQISLSFSDSEVYSKKYIEIPYNSSGEIIKLDYENKTLNHQKLLRKFKISNDDFAVDNFLDRATNNKPVGLLVNGTEIYSSTLYDENIYYGKLNHIEVSSQGNGYDVINSPKVSIADSLGFGAKVYPNITGSIKGVKILDIGNGYEKNVKLLISGGNGVDAALKANVIRTKNTVGFRGDGNGVNPTNNTITFTTPHNFDDGEEIEYLSNSNIEIEYREPITDINRKLPNNSFYFAGIITDKIIKLYRTKEAATNKTNSGVGIGTTEINLVLSSSSGFHYFRTLKSRYILVDVLVENSGINYSNKSVYIPSVETNSTLQNGIDTYNDLIYAKNHYFNEKDLVVYTTTGTPITGLTTESKYYVKVLDKNRFSMFYAGIGNSITDENYYKNKVARLGSVGVGTHIFSYPPIELKIEASPEFATGEFKLPILEPIVTGRIESVFIETPGERYGVPDIINFHRKPNIIIGTVTSQALLRPIVVDGKIIDVQILNFGRGYGKDVDLIINGNGKFADIHPVIQNGRIISVNIINGGIGYTSNTTIDVVSRGSGARLSPNVNQWKINQVKKNEILLSEAAEGILFPSRNQQTGLQFIHFYPPKELRKILNDNISNDEKENLSPKTSPILGWSYDGFPIYGPYQTLNGEIRKIRSSYRKNIQLNSNFRPTGIDFPEGFFIQDFIFDRDIGDLDEYNGKFIKNDDFPNGTYAYFYPIEVDTDGKSFPQYPYVIGDQFKHHPELDNFNPVFNQDKNLSELNLIRNISPYYLNSTTSFYDAIDNVEEKYKQDFIVKNITKAGVDQIDLYERGQNYKVGDILEFDRDKSKGTGLYATVSSIQGKQISSINVGITTLYPVRFEKTGNIITGISSVPLEFTNESSIVISDISSPRFKFIEGKRTVNILSKKVGITTNILSGVSGDIITIYPNDISLFEVDDFIQIDDEEFKIIEIIQSVSAFRVQRISIVTGVHTAGISTLTLLSRKFSFTDSTSRLPTSVNKTVYFDASSVVGLGQTYTLENNINIIIPQKTIYIPNHSFNTGKPLTYHPGFGGNSLSVNNIPSAPYFQLGIGQTVYAVNYGRDFVGISTIGFTSSVGIGSTLNSLFFNPGATGLGVGHSFTTQFTEVIGKIENYSIIINTQEKHQLSNNDTVSLNLIPELNESIKFRYDPVIRKITTELINFDASNIDLVTDEIEITSKNLKTGDKVVYYNQGNTIIGGLTNNQTYFVIKDAPDKIKLANYYADAFEGNSVALTSVGSGTQGFAKINPEIIVTKGNYITFDLSDASLSSFTMRLYKDKTFNSELEEYNYVSNNIKDLRTSLDVYPREIYYSFCSPTSSVCPDNEVYNNNLIQIVGSNYTNTFNIEVIDDDTFEIDLPSKPERLDYTLDNTSTVTYTTTSTNVNGPIDKIKISYGGKGYIKTPKLLKIQTEKGKNAVIKAKSNKIGRISSIERIKDGFDYPTDTTLLPLLSAPAVVQVEGISRIDYVGVITGGKNYNRAPSLKVLGNDNIQLRANLQGSSVVSVNVIQNTNNLSTPLTVLPIRNSNGYGIDDITVAGDIVTLELVNVNNQIYPLIAIGYGTTQTVFPFKIDDEIFIERCRIAPEIDVNGNPLIRNNYNSSNYDYRFFKVTGINTTNYTVSYSMAGIATNLGEYTADFGYGYGYVVNKKDMAEFEMFIVNDLSYTSGETVLGYDENGTNTFSAKVMENGWDNDINELRLTNVQGELKVGNKLRGLISKLDGLVTDVNIFNLPTTLEVTRDKLNDLGDRVGFLNDYQQRLSDNDYYQKFSYSIKGKVPYNIWKDPVKSVIHPSGFKEFSDLTIQSFASANMKVGTASSLSLLVNIDNTQSMYTKNNFGMVYEDDQFEDGSIERILFEEGVALKPYILSTSNKVIRIDDISSQFTGTSNLGIVTTKQVSFASTQLYQIGVNTEGLNVGDKIGYSTYHFNPDSTYILTIGTDYVGFSSDTPHRLYSNNGISTTITQTLSFYRRILGDKIVGVTSFKLKNDDISVFYREFDATDTKIVNIENNSFNLENHNLQTGQKIIYTPQYMPITAVATTTVGSGAILEPVFVGTAYSVSRINVISGGSGYDNANKPLIEILGTKSPLGIGTFNPLIQSGIITSIQIIYPGYGYFPNALGEIGIHTSAESEGRKDIIMAVGGGIGSAIYERGYNVAISTTVSGISSSVVPNFSGQQNVFWVFNDPYIPVKSTTGAGVDAKFSVFIVYNSTTGSPISTSVILRDGGRGYSIGDTVSIAGTYMGGQTPGNDLSFVVSKIANTRVVSGAGVVYTNVPSQTLVGYGKSARFNVSRNSLGDISNVSVIFGGKDYELTDNVAIAGTYIGGNTPLDNLFLSPILLGTDKLPRTLYVDKISNISFKVAGISTGDTLDFSSIGVGTHTFETAYDPNASSLVTIDNIIQYPPYRKNLQLSLSKEVGFTTNIVYVQSGISSVILNDILQINDEYLSVKNINIDGPNSILVERGFIGTKKSVHNLTDPVYVISANYNIVGDIIYFTTAPYGPTGLPGFEVKSSFAARAFSRRFDPFNENDENLIFDDVSNQFNGIGATNFILKSNGENVVGIFTNTNSITGASAGVDINNNPLILINNISQIGGEDYIIDTPGQNTIRFISGVPLAGKITKVGYTTGFGYQSLVGASATVSVSAAGTISNVYLTGFGKGYRTAPLVSIASTVGIGASLLSTISVGGTITSLTIANPGSGYTNTILPEVRIDLPQNYYNIPLVYDAGTSGVGTGAKASVIVGNGSSIISFNLDNPGKGYKVGDILVAPGITTIPNTANFQAFKITVLETFTDSFSGWYPGQFIQFDDLSPFFNGRKKKFVITVTQNGLKETISLKSNPDNVSLEDNLFVLINDILQVPGEAYTFSGSRLTFTEAPKANSKCNVLFFRGSDLDVEQVDPPKTIKEGDEVQISENINDPFDRQQFERVVKDIVAVDILDTFPYDSIGINTDITKIRPINWTKQTQDRIMNGSLYSKSRPSLKSRITPTARIIKNISKTDTKIYVDSATPLFEDLDETRGVPEDLRDIIVLDNRQISEPTVKVNVSASSSISSIDIINSGNGYQTLTNPVLAISSRFIERKDPIYNWTSSGIVTTLNFNSVGYGTGFVSVGSSGLTAISYNGTSWEIANRISPEYDFNDVIGYQNTYVSVGQSASVYSRVGLSTNISWSKINLFETPIGDGFQQRIPSNFDGVFNKVIFNPDKNILVAIGQTGNIFSSSSGISTALDKKVTPLTSNLNSISYNSIRFVSVGDNGDIIYTDDQNSWNNISNKNTTQNLNDIIWDGSRFIAVGNNSTIISSLNGITWNIVSSSSIGNISRIYYSDGIYSIINSVGKLYYSLNLSYWELRQVSSGVILRDIISTGIEDNSLYVSVGSTGFISHSTPVINKATTNTTTLNGSLNTVSITNGGFGYSTSKNILAIVETEVSNREQVYSIKAKGDYGIIKDVTVYPSNTVGFGTTSPAIEFVLQSENFNVSLPTIEYTQPEIGDYFIISDSNVICGHALTGITTSLGGMANYPASKVGTATTFIDGIYSVENVTSSSLGITTVRCFFAGAPTNISINIGINTTGFYGRYSFGIIYDYQNRSRENPKSFIINKDNGLIGINSGPMIYRTRGIV